MDRQPQPAVNLIEFEEIARSILPQMHFDYIAGGAGDEVTLRANREAFAKWRFVYRVLQGNAQADTTTSVLGHSISMPVLLSPVAFQRLCHDAGEVLSAAAARTAGTIYTLSTLSTRRIEDVGQATDAWWFQLYFYSDKAISLDLIRRAEAAGASAIVITVDTPLLGRREADERNHFVLPEGLEQVNLMQTIESVPLGDKGSQLAAYVSGLWHPALSWDDVEWVAAQTKLPVGVKGVVAPEDGRLAVEHGMKLVIVSNHGGRQLDHAIASLDALEGVVDAVAGGCEVLMDGGVRRGTDVIKALALGARAVMIGRPYVWGLASAGQEGVEQVLALLRAELTLDMLLCGAAKVADIDRSLILPT